MTWLAALDVVRQDLRSAWRGITRTPGLTAMITLTLTPEYRPWRLGAELFSAFGLLALAVSLVGIYSTVSYTVSLRNHEFGVRLALGARGRGACGRWRSASGSASRSRSPQAVSSRRCSTA